MYVKMMHENETHFDMFEVHKGQRACIWSPPGQGMELHIVENTTCISKQPIYGAVYILSETGKTIASYMPSLKIKADKFSGMRGCDEMQSAQMSR